MNNSNKGSAVIWMILILIAIGAGAYFVLVDGLSNDRELAAWNSAVEGSGSVVCDTGEYLTGDESPKVYISSGRFSQTERREVPSSVNERGYVEQKLVVTDRKTYIWTDGDNREPSQPGMVTEGNAVIDGYESLRLQNESLESIEEIVQSDELECRKESVSESRFKIPDDIEFQEIQ